MKHAYIWFVIIAIVGTCAIGLAVGPQDSTNSPPIIRGTNQQSSVTGTARTSTNATLPPMYQGGISNLHDTAGTAAVNHGNNDMTPSQTNSIPQSQTPFFPGQQ
jgi:hypothetical protein